jgi:S1-C subfamily serine protease
VASLRSSICVSAILVLFGCSAAPFPRRDFLIDTSTAPAAAELSTSIRGLLHQTQPSFVALLVSESKDWRLKERLGTPSEASAAGSGFLIDNNGNVITAAHVAMREGSQVDARAPDGRIYSGSVVKVRAGNDVALIKLSGFSGAPVTPAARACMGRGEAVFSLGKPYPKPDVARLGEVESMTFGRSVRYRNYGYPDAMVLKMSTQKGESGGPVFNRDGELTGMVVSRILDLAGKPLNLAHAIPAPALARFVCEATKCSRKWRSLVDQDISRCGQWDNLGRVGAATARLRHRSRGEHEFSELLGSDVRSLISGVSVGARDWRHISE